MIDFDKSFHRRLVVGAFALIPLLAGGVAYVVTPNYDPTSGAIDELRPTFALQTPNPVPGLEDPVPVPVETMPVVPGLRSVELEVLRLTNLERAAYGLPALTWNDQLAQAALDHAVDMSDHNYFSHTGLDGSSVSDRVERAGYLWRSVGENIAMGQRSPEEVVTAWMNSPGHRANILRDSFTELGVGLTEDFYWVQKFGAPH